MCACVGNVCVCVSVCAPRTEDGAALAVSGQQAVEDEEEHDEAQRQGDLEGVPLAAP